MKTKTCYETHHNCNGPSCREDVTLANGRVVTHSRMDNGAQSANMADCGDMSQSEWEDYCDILAKRNAVFIERQRTLRKSEALAKISARV